MIVSERDVTGFAAFGTIVKAVEAEADVVVTFADGAVLVAGAVFLGLVALGTNNLLTIGRHRALRKRDYLRWWRAASGRGAGGGGVGTAKDIVFRKRKRAGRGGRPRQIFDGGGGA